MGLSCLQLQSQPEHWPYPEDAPNERRQKRRRWGATGLLGGGRREISVSCAKSHVAWLRVAAMVLYFP